MLSAGKLIILFFFLILEGPFQLLELLDRSTRSRKWDFSVASLLLKMGHSCQNYCLCCRTNFPL